MYIPQIPKVSSPKKRLLSRCRRWCRRGRHAPHDLVAVPRGAAQAMLATSQRADAWKAGSLEFNHHWLVVWNLAFYFPYIGNNNPNWLIFFRGVDTTNQIKLWRFYHGLTTKQYRKIWEHITIKWWSFNHQIVGIMMINNVDLDLLPSSWHS